MNGPLKRYSDLLIISLLAVGCGAPEGVTRIKSEAGSQKYVYHRDAPYISFIKGTPPRKTSLVIFNLETKKESDLHFKNVSFVGAHSVLFDRGLAVAPVEKLSMEGAQAKLLVIDVKKKEILKAIPISERSFYIDFKRPPWSKDGFAVLSDSQKLVLKTINLETFETGETRVVGEYYPKEVFFFRTVPKILFQVQGMNGKQQLILYDLGKGSIEKSIEMDNVADQMTPSWDETSIYLTQPVLGETAGSVLRFDVGAGTLSEVVRINDGVETLLWADDALLAVGRDYSRADEQKRYWLHPRTLYVIDPLKKTIKEKAGWTERQGQFFGFHKQTNELLFAVTDNDAPAVWVIRNDRKVLKALEGWY